MSTENSTARRAAYDHASAELQKAQAARRAATTRAAKRAADEGVEFWSSKCAMLQVQMGWAK